MSEETKLEEGYIKVEAIFIRHRNILAVKGKFSELYTDYYLHLMQHELKYQEGLDLMLKESMAALTLHLVARPWRETIAWTVNLRAPRVNLFVTGGSLHEAITGRVFTEDVREPDRNMLYSQTLEKSVQPRTSAIEVNSTKPLEWVEDFYAQSEQRPGKCFELPDEEFVLFACQPDFDEEWFANLNQEVAEKFLETEETKVIETRKFRFHCGCSLEKIIPALGAWKDKPEELFQGEEKIVVQCPRCAARYLVTEEDLKGK